MIKKEYANRNRTDERKKTLWNNRNSYGGSRSCRSCTLYKFFVRVISLFLLCQKMKTRLKIIVQKSYFDEANLNRFTSMEISSI